MTKSSNIIVTMYSVPIEQDGMLHQAVSSRSRDTGTSWGPMLLCLWRRVHPYVCRVEHAQGVMPDLMARWVLSGKVTCLVCLASTHIEEVGPFGP